MNFGPYGAGWRYLALTTGVAPPAGWYLNSYDDSAWSVGQGGFGSVTGLGGVRIRNTTWNGVEGGGAGTELYLRLTLPSLGDLLSPAVNLNLDDVGEIYVGGSLWYTRAVWTTGVYEALPDPIPDSLRSATPTILAAHVVDTGGGAAYFDLSLVQPAGAVSLWTVGEV